MRCWPIPAFCSDESVTCFGHNQSRHSQKTDLCLVLIWAYITVRAVTYFSMFFFLGHHTNESLCIYSPRAIIYREIIYSSMDFKHGSNTKARWIIKGNLRCWEQKQTHQIFQFQNKKLKQKYKTQELFSEIDLSAFW